MACTVTINSTNPTKGTYGVYNSNAVFIENVSGSTTNLKFRVRITDADSTQYTLDVVPNANNDAIIDPFIRLRDTYFKGNYNGFAEVVNAEGWNTVQIEVGEISGTPATFQGYDTDDTIYFHNGYSKDVEQQNGYRESNWYNSTPFLLPKTKKTLYLQLNDLEIISIPNPVNATTGVYFANDFVITYYDASGSVLSTTTIDLTARPAFSANPTGYWEFNMNSATLHNGTTAYAEAYVVYETAEAEIVNSEVITMYPQSCQPKYDYFRLAWVNRYGGWEFQNYTMRRSENIQITRGKKILSDGNDYASTTYAGIKDVNNPQITEFGKSYQRQYTLRSNWLTQEEIDSLEECFTSPKVIMLDSLGFFGTLTPVIVEDSSYEIQDVKQGLKKVEVRVSISNRQPTQLR